MSESILQKNICKYATENGLIFLKLRLLGVRGWPDVIFFGPGEQILFVEFKSLGKKPRKIQLFIHKLLKRFAFNVMVIDSQEQGEKIIRKYFKL